MSGSRIYPTKNFSGSLYGSYSAWKILEPVDNRKAHLKIKVKPQHDGRWRKEKNQPWPSKMLGKTDLGLACGERFLAGKRTVSEKELLQMHQSEKEAEHVCKRCLSTISKGVKLAVDIGIL